MDNCKVGRGETSPLLLSVLSICPGSYISTGQSREWKYYRGKEILQYKTQAFWLKEEVSVLPTAIVAQYTEQLPGSVSNIDIMYRTRAFRTTALQKVQEEEKLRTWGFFLISAHASAWAILTDERYEETAEFVDIVHPRKKPPREMLGLDYESFNGKVSSDCFIMENWSRQNCSPFTVTSSKFRWSENNYGTLYQFRVALKCAYYVASLTKY